MNDFQSFLEENNYKDDLEFQLCDLEMAFNAGKELQWKPSEEQIEILDMVLTNESMDEKFDSSGSPNKKINSYGKV